MSYKLVGSVVSVGDTIQVTDKFKKRDLVLSFNDGKYDQFVSIQFTGENTSKLDGVGQGESIEVSFNLKGREWQSPNGEVKYFNTLEGWKVSNSTQENVESTTPEPASEGDLPF